ncbi:MAG: FmdB family zinc ribbon protein [Acidimicrobiales bacterium]
MPVYEYACKACGRHLEVSQSFKDEPLTECPVCGGPLRKVFHSIGVVLKGSGFYRTDSRLPSKKSEAAEKSSEKAAEKAAAKASGDSKSESKSEGKSESKSEAKPSGSSTPKSA